MRLHADRLVGQCLLQRGLVRLLCPRLLGLRSSSSSEPAREHSSVIAACDPRGLGLAQTLLEDLGDDAGADGVAALADREAHAAPRDPPA